LIKILAAGAGGFIGAALRMAIAVLYKTLLPDQPLPLATLTVNLSGCFLIGLLNAVFGSSDLFPENLRIFIITGILGGFTTFSAFSFENYELIKHRYDAVLVINIMLQVGGGLAAVWAGFKTGKLLI
jgi:CrcB protein